eukprot:6199428-Pleurochrysis_carterae.AAC.1
MPISQQIPGCGARAWNRKLSWRSFRENGIETRQPCRVECHLVTVSRGRGNVTKGSCHRKVYAPLTQCIFRQYTDIRRIYYFVGIALNVTPLAK